jgi:hypothetical protein
MEPLDPYQRPPDSIRNVYKKYQRISGKDLNADPCIVHLSPDLAADPTNKLHVVREVDANRLTPSFRAFTGHEVEPQAVSPVIVYEHEDMPGRALLSPAITVNFTFSITAMRQRRKSI